MNTNRPFSAQLFTLLCFAAALFTLWLGTMASAYYFCSICLLISAWSLWTARCYPLFKWILLLNQLTSLILIVAIAWRKLALPEEQFSLQLSGVALVGNLLFGGPFLALLSIPLLNMLFVGKTLPAWFTSRA